MAIDELKLKEDVKKYYSTLKPQYISKLVEAVVEDIIDIIDEQPKLSLETKTSDKDVPDNNVEKMNREFEELEVAYFPDELCIYPEYIGKPYFAIRYKENGNHFVGYGTYSPEVLSRYLRDYFMPLAMPKESKWIPVTERLPDEHENYIVTVCDECNMIWAETVVVLAEYFEGSWLWYEGGDEYDITDMVIAWMTLPEPYKGE